MDVLGEIKALAARIPQQLDHINTEEATKNALVMPFLSVLGYDIFDPTEVVPEFSADVGGKKGEKVDYAIMVEGRPEVLVECKKAGSNLDEADVSQLFRYFTATDARIGILTDGITYRFFSDLDHPNRMDTKPFLDVILTDLNNSRLHELERFSKSSFNLDEMLEAAADLKYTNEIKRILGENLREPSDDFVRLFAGQIYSGRMTESVRHRFAQMTKKAFQGFINDRIEDRLRAAMAREVEPSDEEEDDPEPHDERTIETTLEETEGFLVVKAILRDAIDVSRVHMRDTLSYCGVLLDDNNRKPIYRLHFNSPQKYLGLFDQEKNEERMPIDSLDGIYEHADRIKAAVGIYDAV